MRTLDEDSARTISVSGTAEVKTTPDRIVWSIDLLDTDKDLQAARKRSEEKAKAILALKPKLGVAEGDIETGPVSVRRDYEHDLHGHQGAFKGFVVSRSITIRERDLKRFDEFLQSLLTSAEMEVNFAFESSKILDIRAEARLRAMKIAQEKAAAMAGAVGAKLGPVMTIKEDTAGGALSSRMAPYNNASNWAESGPAVDVSSGTMIPGALSERVTVCVTFALE